MPDFCVSFTVKPTPDEVFYHKLSITPSLPDSLLSTIHTPGPVKCAALCAYTTCCMGYNYTQSDDVTMNGVCKLYSELADMGGDNYSN